MEDARNNGNFKCRKEKDGVQQQERETVSDKVAKQIIERCVGKLNENMGDVLRVLMQAPKKKGKWIVGKMAMMVKDKKRFKARVKHWLCDTGCGHDLIGFKAVSAMYDHSYDAGGVEIVTAAGEAPAHRKIPLDLEYIGEKVTPCVLEETPAVLTIGRRAREAGYSSIWLSGKWPCWIIPSQDGRAEIITFEVEDDCPMCNDDPNKYKMSREQIIRHYGVIIEDGKCFLQHDFFTGSQQTQALREDIIMNDDDMEIEYEEDVRMRPYMARSPTKVSNIQGDTTVTNDDNEAIDRKVAQDDNQEQHEDTGQSDNSEPTTSQTEVEEAISNTHCDNNEENNEVGGQQDNQHT